MDSRARARDDLVQYPITVIPSNNGKGSDDDFLYKRNVLPRKYIFLEFSVGLGGCVLAGVSSDLWVLVAPGVPGRVSWGTELTLPHTR